MFTGKVFTIRNRVSATVLTTLGWLIVTLCWLAFAWRDYSALQNLASLAICTLFYVAIVGVIWLGDLGFGLAATIVATMGWFSMLIYWIGFSWSQHSLLQNGAVLSVSFLIWLGTALVFCLAGPAEERL